MPTLCKPTSDTLRRFLEEQATQALTYAEVGATDATPPSGYAVNHTRIRLGSGQPTYSVASDLLKQWRQLHLGWVSCWPPAAPIETGQQVAILGWACGLWWRNACRIVYTIDQAGSSSRFGYAQGTLPEHLASGEERFLVERDEEDNVWFDILSFSRPNHWLSRATLPYLRSRQKRFGQQSAQTILQLVTSQIERRR